MRAVRIGLITAAIVVLGLGALSGPAGAGEAMGGKVPITTTSEPARQAYLQGRELLEKLRATDARVHFLKAAELDPGFALAQYGSALTAPTAGEFFAALAKAVALAEKASEGEKHMVRALEAGVNGKPAEARKHLAALVAAYPGDERAHNLLGGYFFGRQEWQAAVEEYRKATAIAPQFSQPYNQLGYALRFLERYGEAEEVFKTYTEVLPNEPNPFDSYAELLMKVGRFDESIAQYQKALAIEPTFVASYVGIANDQIFSGRGEAARATLAKLGAIARNDGERRQVCTWSAVSYLHEGNSAAALAEVERCLAIAKQADDRTTMAGDLAFMGTILLESGQAEAALAKYAEGVRLVDNSKATADVKEAAHRNALFNTARVALLRKDVAGAAEQSEKYGKLVAVRGVPFEVWQAHQLAGLVAMAKGDFSTAVAELVQANQQNPQVLYQLGEAYLGAGDGAAARQAFARAANFNALGVNYAYIRAKALAKLKG